MMTQLIRFEMYGAEKLLFTDCYQILHDFFSKGTG